MDDPHATWTLDWLWSLPLIVLCVVIHVVGLGLINERVVRLLTDAVDSRRFLLTFSLVIGAVTLLATALHAIEGGIWAVAYVALGALPDFRTAMLYSLGAMATYGHANLFLEARWQMMGALEAVNGMLLFGLSTAFLFAVIQKVWPLGSRGRRRPPPAS